MKRVVMIHTSPVSLEDLKALCQEIIPDVEVFHIIDDSLLDEVKKHGGLTPGIIGRMNSYVKQADSLKPDLIFNQCSSVGEAFDLARRQVSCKTLKVDEPMAEKAVSLGSRIAVVATVASTMEPSCNLIRRTAKQMNREVTVDEFLVDGALDVLMKEKNQEKHNKLCLEAIRKATAAHDVVVLAQGSMTVLLPWLQDMPVPVLTSPRMAIERVKELLEAD